MTPGDWSTVICTLLAVALLLVSYGIGYLDGSRRRPR